MFCSINSGPSILRKLGPIELANIFLTVLAEYYERQDLLLLTLLRVLIYSEEIYRFKSLLGKYPNVLNTIILLSLGPRESRFKTSREKFLLTI